MAQQASALAPVDLQELSAAMLAKQTERRMDFMFVMYGLGIKNCLGEAIVRFYATPIAPARKFLV